jgi:uncharacterized membrane protein
MTRHTFVAIVGLAVTAAPAFAQHEQHGQQAKAAGQGDMMQHMICEMGVLPHPGMGAMMGEGMGQGMQHGQPAAAAPGMQHGQPGAAAPGMQHGQPGAEKKEMGGMMGGMKMDHTRTAHMLVEHGDEMGLALTEEQKVKMTQLAEAASASCATHIEAAKTSHVAAVQALDKGDLDAYEDGLEDAMEHAIQAHVPVIRSGIEAKALLTDAQRDKATGQSTGMRQRPDR